MVRSGLQFDRGRLAELCRRHHITRLSLFGSALRDDFRPDSDVDLLVEFAPDHYPSWNIIDIEDEFSALFGGRRVDLIDPRYLLPRLRGRILSTAQVAYDAEG